jgi:hypothetical protein
LAVRLFRRERKGAPTIRETAGLEETAGDVGRIAFAQLRRVCEFRNAGKKNESFDWGISAAGL